MIKRYLHIIIAVTLLLLSSSLFAEVSDIYFRSITVDDGLPANNVNAIVQADDGFIWIGTEEGCCRYDGYSFLNFSHSRSDSTSLSNSHVDCIAKDKRGNLWVGTRSGLNFFDMETHKITRIRCDFDPNFEISSIQDLYISSQDLLYIATVNNALYVLDIYSRKLTQYKHDSANSNTLASDVVNAFGENHNKQMWIGTTAGLDLFDPSTENFTHYYSDKDVRTITSVSNDAFLVSFFEDSNRYHITKDGFHKKASQLEGFQLNTAVVELYDSQGSLWTSVSDLGLYYEDKQDDTCVFMCAEADNETSISGNNIYSIFEDNIGNIWVGTSNKGLNILDVNRKGFGHVYVNGKKNGLRSNFIRATHQDSEGDIWIGTKVNGMLSKFDPVTSTFEHYEHKISNPSSLSDDFVFCITEATPGYLWVGTMRGGLNLFNKGTGIFEHIQYHKDKPYGLKSNYILSLCQRNENELWIGHLEHGIDMYSPQEKTFINYQKSEDTSSLSSNNISFIFNDKHGDVWVGTWYGLNKYNEKNDNFTRFIHEPDNPNSISNNQLICVLEDSQDRLWFGTKYGLNLLNKADLTFKSYTQEDGLPNDVIAGIAEGENGELWLSTNMGLSKFNPQEETFINYTQEDGLQGNSFAKYASLQTKEGALLFGGNNGFNFFNPKDIVVNKTLPQIRLTELKIFNEAAVVGQADSPLSKHISRTNSITLNYKQNELTLAYVALNYSSSARVEYAYMMEGYDKGWNDVGAKREALYTNLDAGEYTFRVKASNSDGVWNEEGISLHISILPPPWLTWWAYICYALFALFLLYWFRHSTIKKIKKEKEHEMDQQKLGFFIDVSHEIRTPISLILNPASKMMEQKGSDENMKMATSIYQSAQKITNLVNQLLDFQKLERGKMPLSVVKMDIVDFTQEIVELFADLAAVKNIKLQLKVDEEMDAVWLDSEKYENILNNLLSNAVKFTPNNGSINVSLQQVEISSSHFWKRMSSKSHSEAFVALKVQDTGVGIKADHLNKIFNRFYRIDEKAMGTGIGLNFIKKIVELHQGKISVESVYGLGSTFTVLLPREKAYYNHKQLREGAFDLTNHSYNSSSQDSLMYELHTKDSSVKLNSNALPDASSEGKKTILVVEDNKALREQLVSELQAHYLVLEAANGVQGLEVTEKHFPDLVISDVMMPEMDGIQFCAKIKEDKMMGHIPVILLTAKSLKENRIEGYANAADDYMTKPFDMHVLKLRVENILAARHLLKEKYGALSFTFGESKKNTTNKEEAFLDEITTIALANITNPDFTHNDLISEGGYSQTAFYRKMAALTDMTPGYFMHTVKIKYAAQRLLNEDVSVKEICFDLGYNSQSYFNKNFLKIMGDTPSDYIKKMKPEKS